MISNIETFDEIVGNVFATLYNSFPLPVSLLVAQYVGENNVIDPKGYTGAELTKDAEFFMASIDWLTDAQFITAKEKHLEGFLSVVLTAKGLEAMKSTPDSLKAPLGERLIEASKEEGREMLRGLVNQALGIGLKLITNT